MENSSHHRNVSGYEAYFYDELKQAYEEDLLLFESSAYYAAIYNKIIIGSVKITLWDGQAILPLEKLFNIQCRELSFYHDDVLVWHVGRLAVSKSDNPFGMKLIMQLLTLAIYNICQHANSIMVAECDKKLLRGLNRMGIKTEALGRGIEYLGSETIPVYATDEWLKVFLQNNSYVEEMSKIVGGNGSLFTALLPVHDEAAL